MILCFVGLWLACVDERARVYIFIELFYCSHLGPRLDGWMDGWMAFPGE